MNRHQVSSDIPGRHKARKRFGQNFLRDHSVISRIVASIGIKPDDHIVEIGPGHGALTREMAGKSHRLDVIELDRDLVPWLKVHFDRYERFGVHEADALTFDFSALLDEDEQKIRLVGNLPYNISTPLIFHALTHAGNIRDMHFMLQKEVVQRLTATEGSKSYGRLSIMVQYYCKAQALFDVAAEAFDPAPKVTSAVVQLTPHEKLPFPCRDIKTLSDVVTTAFSARRKAVRNSLKSVTGCDELLSLGVDPGLRPEQLSLETYVRIADACYARKIDSSFA